MRKLCLCFVMFVSTAAFSRADFILDDIQFWAGTGTNRAGLVVDFQNGTSVAWGYRWNGSATGEDMVRAIAAAPDSGLYSSLGFFTGYGYYANGFGYDGNNNNVFSTNPGLTFTNGIANVASGNPARTAADATPGDVYVEADGSGFSSYWSYWNKSADGQPWTFASTGMSSRVLADGEWDGWSFDPNSFDTTDLPPSEPFAAPAAVPEPGPMMLVSVALGLGIVVARARRRRAALA